MQQEPILCALTYNVHNRYHIRRVDIVKNRVYSGDPILAGRIGYLLVLADFYTRGNQERPVELIIDNCCVIGPNDENTSFIASERKNS